MKPLRKLPAVAILLTFMLVFSAFTAPPAFACDDACKCCGCDGNCDQTPATSCEPQTPCVSSTIYISKHPWDEWAVPQGTPTSFIVAATGWDWISWEFMTSHGEILTVDDVTSNYGYTVLGWDSTKLVIRDMPWGLDGWQVRAVFHDSDGCEKRTNWAHIGVTSPPCYEPPICYQPEPPCQVITPCNPEPCYDSYLGGVFVGTGGFVQTGPTMVHTQTATPGVYVTDSWGFVY